MLEITVIYNRKHHKNIQRAHALQYNSNNIKSTIDHRPFRNLNSTDNSRADRDLKGIITDLTSGQWELYYNQRLAKYFSLL